MKKIQAIDQMLAEVIMNRTKIAGLSALFERSVGFTNACATMKE